MTTVKTLLDLPGLRPHASTGRELLDRTVTRIFVTELPDPGRYLSAGELVLSGLLWWREPGDAEPFVAALAESGAAALAASGADTGGIPADLVESCARHRIPLLEVPPDLSFAVITERVVLALAAASDHARKRLLAAAAEDAPIEGLLRSATTELGLPCWVVSTLGRVVAGTGPLPGTADDIVRRFLGRRRSGKLTLIPIEGRHAVPWLLAVGGPLTAPQTELAEELAGLVGLARARADQVRRVADRVVDPVLAGGDVQGLGLTGELRVIAVRTEGSDEAQDVLRELLADHSGRVLVGSLDGDAYALAEDNGDWPSDTARALSTVEPLLTARGIRAGISDRVPVSALHGAQEVARHALAVAAARPGPVAVVPAGEVGVHQLLLAGAPDQLRAVLRRRVLGPLLDYDAEQHSDLVHTLRVFLDCSGSPTRAAKALHVHVNTLRYRIGRASELLGVDLTEFTAQLDVYLALLAEG
ncbi:PucR family transcriptional regulator ligand-binding domain-containing protein [Amycolatopsis sp. NPDC059021]|uniref:helix-turn-helix domain-containing protein n=1 Tax=Amycolatopsis sp. NPDC059021 TaxID=3346704 RepID=UPI00366B9818